MKRIAYTAIVVAILAVGLFLLLGRSHRKLEIISEPNLIEKDYLHRESNPFQERIVEMNKDIESVLTVDDDVASIDGDRKLGLYISLSKELGAYNHLEALVRGAEEDFGLSDDDLIRMAVVSGMYMDLLNEKRIELSSINTERDGYLEIRQEAFSDFGMSLRNEYMNVLEGAIGPRAFEGYKKSLREQLDLNYFHGWGTGSMFIEVSPTADGLFNIRIEELVASGDGVKRLPVGDGRLLHGSSMSISSISIEDLENSFQTSFISDLISRYK